MNGINKECYKTAILKGDQLKGAYKKQILHVK